MGVSRLAGLRPWIVALMAAASVTTCADSTAPDGRAVRYSAVVAGLDFSCGLGSDSLAYCWGYFPALGYSPYVSQGRVRPTAVRGGHRFVRIDAGGDKACGTEAGGAIRCWGSEMLGDGSVDRDSVPRLVGGGLALQSLAIGQQIACGLTADAVAYCWGPNDYGQLGIGSQSDMELLPRAVAGGAMKFKRVSPGGLHVCGIALDDRVYCWGNNTRSQLGRDSAPEVCFPGNPPQCAFLPVPVADTQTYMTIAAGAYHTCGLTFTGQAFCWGSAEEGALGTAFAVAPTPEAVVTDLRFTMLVSGVDTNCGLIASGAVYCWGSNGYGQLGTDNPTYTCPARPHPLCSPFPEPVTGGLAFRSLSAQFGHTCGLSVAGLAYCWGNGWWGQLGDGNPYDHISYVPVRVIEQSDPPP